MPNLQILLNEIKEMNVELKDVQLSAYIYDQIIDQAIDAQDEASEE